MPAEDNGENVEALLKVRFHFFAQPYVRFRTKLKDPLLQKVWSIVLLLGSHLEQVCL